MTKASLHIMLSVKIKHSETTINGYSSPGFYCETQSCYHFNIEEWLLQPLPPALQLRKDKEIMNKTKESLNKVEWETVFHLRASSNATWLPLVALKRKSSLTLSLPYVLLVPALYISFCLSPSLPLFFSLSLTGGDVLTH